MVAAARARVIPMAAPSPSSSWPITGDIPAISEIVLEQSQVIEDQEVLLHAYQTNLNTAQTTPGATATGTGTATGNQLAVTAVAGTIQNGAVISGGGVTVPAGTTILGQISGTPGGAGTYLTSAVTTAAAAALTFTNPPGASTWPVPTDAPTLMLIQQLQSSIIRLQTALLQGYQDLMNTSQTPAPPTGP